MLVNDCDGRTRPRALPARHGRPRARDAHRAAGTPGLRRGRQSCVRPAPRSRCGRAAIRCRGRQRLARPPRAPRRRARCRRDRHLHQQRRRRDVSAAAQRPIRCRRARPWPRSMRCSRARTRARPPSCPTIDGPCLYFRRDCLNAVGAFDGTPLGSDYGVEIDFCLRAGSAGYRHLLAGDVFVGHAGHGTFGAREAEGARRPHRTRARQAVSVLSGAEGGDARARTCASVRAPRRPACASPNPASARWCSCRIRGAAGFAATWTIWRRWPTSALRRAVPRAGSRRHRQAVVAARRRKLRAVLHAAGRAAVAGRHDAHHRRRAPALSSRAPAAARDPRPARGRGRALRLHAARLLPDLSAVPPRDRTTGATAASPTPPVAPHASPGARANGVSTSRRGAVHSANCCGAPNA